MKVTVYEVEHLPGGYVRLGNTIDVEVSEAISMIEQDEAKSLDLPRGQVPPEWLEAVKVDVEE